MGETDARDPGHELDQVALNTVPGGSHPRPRRTRKTDVAVRRLEVERSQLALTHGRKS